jgi:hypothetical protein
VGLLLSIKGLYVPGGSKNRRKSAGAPKNSNGVTNTDTSEVSAI